MSAMAELAAQTTEYGGEWSMHGHWLARDASGRPVDGFRWARWVPVAVPLEDGSEGYRAYGGPSFPLDRAAEVLARLVTT